MNDGGGELIRNPGPTQTMLIAPSVSDTLSAIKVFGRRSSATDDIFLGAGILGASVPFRLNRQSDKPAVGYPSYRKVFCFSLAESGHCFGIEVYIRWTQILIPEDKILAL